MGHPFHHLHLVLQHSHRVICNAAHCGIFFQALRHDLSKFSPTEFGISSRYYVGSHSPVYEERVHNGYYSRVCCHHTKRNKHHWEYWTDFFNGRIIVKTMPWNWAMEYVCDTLSASYCYHPAKFTPTSTLEYFRKYNHYYFMTAATREFIEWCLARYAELGFAGLKKKDTKAKYAEIAARLPEVEVVTELHIADELPPLAK